MKFKISKAEYEKLSDEQKALYTAKGEDYQIAIEGLPDFDGMQTKLNALLDETKTAKKAREEAETKAKLDLEAAAKKSGDVEALEKSWGEKLAQLEASSKTKLSNYQAQIAKLMVTNEAQALSSKLFGKNAALLQHHVMSRLSLEEGENGEFKTRILGADGKPSALSLYDLGKEFAGKEEFKGLLVSTKATGPTGGLLGAEKHQVERKTGPETMDDRRERARQIAAKDAETSSGNQY